VAKDFRNFWELGSLLEHSAGQGMPEEVCRDMFGPLNVGAHKATSRNMADARGPCQRHTRGIRAQEHSLRLPNATIQTQITRNGGADFVRQWKKIPTGSLASDQYLTGSPVKVV
jgi:hypothetical protein